MTGSAFFDTSVLVYAEDHGEPEKRAMALRLLADHIASDDIVLSAQVLNEFYVSVRRLERPLGAAQALNALEQLAAFPVVPVTADLVVAAAAASEEYHVPHWDALILEAARAAGCTVVLSEDLNDGQDYGGVRVENPFKAALGGRP
jgi:predicted nucleic acid-binding protein